MSEELQWQATVTVILPHPARPQILVCRQENGWSLPQIVVPQLWIEPVGRLNDEMWRQFGLETTVLQLQERMEDERRRQAQLTYVFETHSPASSLAAGLRWVGVSELDGIGFTHPQHCVAVERSLREMETRITPALRVPSARPGWRGEAETWIQNQLEQRDCSLTGPITQVKNWFLSCILRAPTAQGMVYFKASHGSPLMVKEAQITGALASLFPQSIPAPIAIEPALDWMLLADFGPEVGWSAPLEEREEVLRAFGRLQIASAERVDELRALGCIDRRLSRLAEEIDPLFQDAEMLAYMDAEQQRQLLAAAARLKAICAELEQYRVPATLMHGDMHMSNVARNGDGYLVFDWSDACIAHPFLDMIEILHEGDGDAQSRLRDSYLTLWTDYEPMERLVEMWQLAYPLCALHQAVSYRYIIANTEKACKSHLAWAMPFWFGKILASLDGP